MKEQAIISSLQKRWKTLSLLSLAMIALAFVTIFITCLHQLFQYSFVWIIPAWLAVFVLLTIALQSWRIQQKDVLVYINRNVAQLEESSELLLQPASSHNLLQQMQVNKLKEAIEHTAAVHPVNKKLKRSAFILLLSVIISTLIFFLVKPSAFQVEKVDPIKTTSPVTPQVLPAVSSVTLKIKSPAYTNIKLQTQEDMNVVAAEGSTVYWQLETNKPVNYINLKFSDTTTLQLRPLNNERTKWSSEKTLNHSGFYQVQLDSILSDLYKLEIIKDEPPTITVQSPKPSLVIDFGEPQKITVKLNVSDDHGIDNAVIMATIASGSGEAVKFSERAINFANTFTAQNKNYTLSKPIDLQQLGMKPGDELYLFIKATDNHRQETSSDTYIISIADTAGLMSFDGTINGVNLKPEYFRSQRQIIIETEKLLKDKPAITQEAFKDKNNDLGVDQKLLRLRYGKFLGEEFEANIGEHDEHTHNNDGNTSFGNAAEIIDEFSHKHDIAEDATFFDTETKKQLKAVLDEMWKAELQLRTFKPADALPFEYKALRLLKDLQQQSRVYVAKTNIKTPPLKPETRLTGELDKIISPATETVSKQNDGSSAAAQHTLSILENLKAINTISNDALLLLLQTNQYMMQQAAASPGKYLAALQSYQRILNNVQQKQNITAKDIVTAQQGLQQMLLSPAKTPSTVPVKSNNLSQQYFRNLNKGAQ